MNLHVCLLLMYISLHALEVARNLSCCTEFNKHTTHPQGDNPCLFALPTEYSQNAILTYDQLVLYDGPAVALDLTDLTSRAVSVALMLSPVSAETAAMLRCL